jgi:hypothetical protein
MLQWPAHFPSDHSAPAAQLHKSNGRNPNPNPTAVILTRRAPLDCSSPLLSQSRVFAPALRSRPPRLRSSMVGSSRQELWAEVVGGRSSGLRSSRPELHGGLSVFAPPPCRRRGSQRPRAPSGGARTHGRGRAASASPLDGARGSRWGTPNMHAKASSAMAAATAAPTSTMLPLAGPPCSGCHGLLNEPCFSGQPGTDGPVQCRAWLV